jgi:hypothetical protein
MKRFLLLFTFILSVTSAFSQGMVTGYIHDAATGEGLVGAVVVVGNGKVHAVADIDGNYTLPIEDGTIVLHVKYVGYAADSATVTVAGKPVVQNFDCSSTSLKEVEIVSDVAIDRKTPVAFSNVNESQIHEELGNRDMTMLLNSTPGAYASEQGGGSGDSRVNVRGVDQRNVGVMVDGIPMNDMETGAVYWANWDGLGDVTRTMQVQRGLGASRLAIPSVGGTINVITKGIDQAQSFTVGTQFGNNSMAKYTIGFNSGEFKKGWGVTFAGSRKTGNGWADQTWDDQWSYFLKVQKRFDKSLFTIGVNGAPQSHAQRYDRMPIAVYDRTYAQHLGINVDSTYANNSYTTSTQGAHGYRYNPNWGFITYNDGQTGKLSQDINFYSKPLFNFSWFYKPCDKLSISTIAYLSVGNGGGTNFNQTINRDTTTGELNLTSAYNSNVSLIDPLYSSTEHKSTRVLLASMNNHIWYGALSTATWTPTDKLSFLFGVDVRHYEGSHYRKVYDLIGGDYYVDNSDKNQPVGTYLGDPNFQNSMKHVGDKVGFYNKDFVDWGGLFSQAEYTGKNWSSFLTLSGSMTQYQRFDYFRKRDIVEDDGTVVPMIVGYNETYYTNGTQSGVAQNGAVITTSNDTTFINNPTGTDYSIANAKAYRWDSKNARTAQTVKKTFPGFTIKAGVNYNLTEHFNVFMNVGYLNMAPRFNTVFDNYNEEYPNPKQQQVYAGEMGFGARFGKFAGNLNMYYTVWKNKPPSYTPTITTPDGTFTYELLGLNTVLAGVEFDGKWVPTKNLQVEGLASIGNWKNSSAGTVYLYDQNYVLQDTITYSAKNIHIGDAAQTQLGAAIKWQPFNGFYVKPRFTYFGRQYANFDPIALTVITNSSGVVVSDNRDRESWKMPAYGLLDLNMGYELKEQVEKRVIIVSFNISVNNILDARYISDGQNGINFDASSALVYMGMGRRWTAGMRFNF